MSDDFDELVARGEDRLASEPTEDELAEQALAATSRRHRDLVQRSLGDPGLLTPFVLVALMLLGTAGPIVVALELRIDGVALQVVSFGAILLCPLALFFGSRAFFRWWAGREVAALRSLPYPFDVERYLRDVGGERSATEPRVVLWFADELDEAAKKRVMHAAVGAPGVTRGQWRTDGALLVIGPRFQSHWRRGDGNTRGSYNNNRAHRWVRRILRRGVAPIHARHPLERVRVMLAG